MNKEDVCVLMSDEMDVRNAEIMLMSYDELIARDGSFTLDASLLNWNYLKFNKIHKSWCIGKKRDIVVSLSELDAILGRSKNDMLINDLTPSQRALNIIEKHLISDISDNDAILASKVTVDEILEILKPTISFVGDYQFIYYQQVREDLDRYLK